MSPTLRPPPKEDAPLPDDPIAVRPPEHQMPDSGGDPDVLPQGIIQYAQELGPVFDARLRDLMTGKKPAVVPVRAASAQNQLQPDAILRQMFGPLLDGATPEQMKTLQDGLKVIQSLRSKGVQEAKRGDEETGDVEGYTKGVEYESLGTMNQLTPEEMDEVRESWKGTTRPPNITTVPTKKQQGRPKDPNDIEIWRRKKVPTS